MTAKVILKVVSGPIRGKAFEFDRHDTFLFGRHSECHARLPKDGQVSRHHFILEANPPDVRVRDLGSLNGTYVNGVKHGGRSKGETPEEGAARRFPDVDLKHGDRVTVGQTTIQLTIGMPVVCCQCGVEIDKDYRSEGERMADGFICTKCRGNLVDRQRPITVLEGPICSSCGKDVSAEVQNGRRGEYVCQECQADLMAKTGGLRGLLQQAAGRMQDPSELKIDGYELGDELGRGGMGVVYQAVRKADRRQVAVKVMLAKIAVDMISRNMFLREVDVARQLCHPNIVSFLEHGSVGSAFYFIMEYCGGGCLSDLMKRHRGKLPLDLAAPLMMQCLNGLSHAHKLKFVHRDLKPENVLLDDLAGPLGAKITDFGLAKSFESAGLSGMTATGRFGGTNRFMPREQLTGFKYFRPVSDVWSMAATFYNMLTGKSPLDFPDDRDPLEVVLHDEPVPIRRRDLKIPEAVARVIDRALLSDPKDRFQTAGEMKSAFKKAF